MNERVEEVKNSQKEDEAEKQITMTTNIYQNWMRLLLNATANYYFGECICVLVAVKKEKWMFLEILIRTN